MFSCNLATRSGLPGSCQLKSFNYGQTVPSEAHLVTLCAGEGGGVHTHSAARLAGLVKKIKPPG